MGSGSRCHSADIAGLDEGERGRECEAGGSHCQSVKPVGRQAVGGGEYWRTEVPAVASGKGVRRGGFVWAAGDHHLRGGSDFSFSLVFYINYRGE